VLNLEAPSLATPFDPIDFSSGAIAAVSGGSDSTALLILLKDHLDRNAPGAKLLAVTVDHGLRHGSDAEAQAVGRLCAQRGIEHRILEWTGPKPARGLPAAARTARYRLLAQAARDAGLNIIVTGHTADDQAETVWMRLQRGGSARRGLAGMAPATLYDGGLWLLRPLLGARREALRGMLRRTGIAWAEDPTNADSRFERPRARKTIHGADADALLALARDAGVERQSLDARAAMLLRRLASQPAVGLLRLSPRFARSDDRPAAIHALRALLAATGGAPLLPDEARVSALFDRLAASEKLRATLSRAVIDRRRDGIYLHREARGLPPPQAGGDAMRWDGRVRITFDNRQGDSVIAPLGMDAACRLAATPASVPQSLVRAALAAEPALSNGRGNAVPAPAFRVVSPWADFLPGFDLETARALAELIGAPPVPAPPLFGHGEGALEQPVKL
jgi:tRNA(Ile)-lysidine synthase